MCIISPEVLLKMEKYIDYNLCTYVLKLKMINALLFILI